MIRHLMRMESLHVLSVQKQMDTQKRKHTIVTPEIFNAKDVLGMHCKMQEVREKMSETSNQIQKKIEELVEVVQKEFVFGAVSSKYMCPKHNRFLKLYAISIELEIREPNTPCIQKVWELWECRECEQIVVKIAAEGDEE